jgi:hypothetical protein
MGDECGVGRVLSGPARPSGRKSESSLDGRAAGGVAGHGTSTQLGRLGSGTPTPSGRRRPKRLR